MKCLPLIIVFFLSFAIASIAQAQTQLNSEVKLGLSYILSFKGVAEDLELSEKQIDQLTGLWIEVQLNLERDFKDYRANYSPRFSDQEQEALQKELAEAIEKTRTSETDKLNEVLLPHQLKRLKQIQFQILRRDGNSFQGLADALKLTRDQLSQLNKIKTKLKTEVQKLRHRARRDQLTQNEVAEEITAFQTRTEKELNDVLSASQREKIKELEGEPFELQIGPPKKEVLRGI